MTACPKSCRRDSISDGTVSISGLHCEQRGSITEVLKEEAGERSCPSPLGHTGGSGNKQLPPDLAAPAARTIPLPPLHVCMGIPTSSHQIKGFCCRLKSEA